MPTAELIATYSQLTPAERHLAQLCALTVESLNRTKLGSLSRESGWSDKQGKQLTQVQVGTLTKKLLRKGIFLEGSYGNAKINPALQDLAIQDCIRQGWFDALSRVVQKKFPSGRHYYYDGRLSRDLRIAFYSNDVQQFKSLAGRSHGPLNLLDPFSQDIYDRLDPVLQEIYLTGILPRLTVVADGEREVVAAFQRWVESQPVLSDQAVACALDLYVASGNLPALRVLDQRTKYKVAEIAGCEALLKGDYERAEVCFAAAMPVGKRGSQKSKTAMNHLPAVFYLLLLLKQNTAEARQRGFSLISSVAKARQAKYGGLMDIFQIAMSFQQSPSSPGVFAAKLERLCVSPLASLVAGYAWNWNLTEDDAPFKITGSQSISSSYNRLGMTWLAAELAGLAGKTSLTSAATMARKCSELHGQLGTQSLVEVARPAPLWQRALDAMSQLSALPAQPGTTRAEGNERLIWELSYSTKSSSIDLRPILQKRTAGGWTKGRKVALARLYEQHNDPEFAFLTEQDVALCRSIEMEMDRNRYGYTETTYYFSGIRAARALVGHPCIFREGDRENALEIAEQEPQLVVTKTDDNRLALSLQPRPDLRHTDRGFRIREEGPRRLVLVFFDKQHLMLNNILGGQLLVPAAAADRVMEAIQPVASLVSVHSEIGTGGPAGPAVAADDRPHLHLLPYQGGLRLEFFVRPFHDEGPFYRPGEGGETVVAKIADQPKTARRDLQQERQQQAAVISACPAIAQQADNETICFASAAEALETLLELEELVASGKVVLHWPQGRSLQLAGQAAASQFKVKIRKDRDWFAASGELKLDKSLSLDMMTLIDLVEASPSRFVKLDDGRFLALTEQLRRRVEDLAAYGERLKGKLRFPPIRAVGLEDLDETVSLKADQHWQQCVQRIRQAGDVCPECPSTLLTELRDYQLAGFQWLARLAHWGVGGCLADDMGLGKTIEALALLLHRAADGPALVVAPTSVAFNWQNEIHRFAPTLNARLFGSGDRDALLQDLGPRDVVICSYGLLHSEAERLQARPWHTVILDEAQAIKNVATKRSQAAMGLEADFRLIMTGTPLENHLGELWNLFHFINPGLLGSLDSYQQRFATPIERDGCRETRRRLKKLIQPFVLRRTKSQVLEELPSRTEVTLMVELGTEEAAFYEALRQRAVEKLADAGESRSQHLQILAELMRLRRACCHPRLVMEDSGIASSKLALFSQTIDELLDNRHKVLVFSQFVDHLTVLREELDRKDVAYQYLDGSTPAKQRKQRVEAFQAGHGDVFLISLKAGGLGLNLTAADYVIHMDPWWNPAVEDQASDRAHRLGQQRPVTIYRFITRGTIEERITALHATKRDLADSLLEGADVSGKLSAQELLRLIRE